MNRITKHNFLSEKTKLNFKTIISGAAFIILLALEIWLHTDNKITFFIIFGVILFIILAVSILDIVLKYKTKHLPSPYYIVEDTFIHVREKEEIHVKHANRIYYTVKFSKRGEYVYYASARWKNREKDDADYSCIFFSKSGDEFYLVISEHNGKICRCYNKKYFVLCEEDFVFIDGKYYPKKN
ncbi:MAG: hypothetical protein IJZ75_06005 [Clostridia bacterium]|nr:hypothetical protein [Clostridia bacterium]